MMKNRFWKRGAALLMSLVMLCCLAACGGKDGGGSPTGTPSGTDSGKAGASTIKGAEKVKLENVYSMEYLTTSLPEDGSVTAVRSVGDKIYVSVYYSREVPAPEGSNEDPTTESGVALYQMDLDGANCTLKTEFPSIYELNEEEKNSISKNVSALAPDRDGGYWYFSQENLEDWADENNYISESSNYLYHIGADGAELAKVDAASFVTAQGGGMGGFGGFGGGIYISKMFVCEDGSLVVNTGSQITVLEPSGQVRYTVPLGMTMLMDMTVTGAGDIIGLKNEFNYMDYTSTTALVKLNADTKAFDTVGEPPLANAYTLLGGPGHSLYFNSGSAVYSYDLETLQMKETLNWINSDVNYNRISNLVPLADGNFLATETDGSGFAGGYAGMGFGGFGFGGFGQQNLKFAILRAKAPGEITEKYIITFAAVSMDDYLQNAVIQFNKQNPDYRIRFKDYSIYNTTTNYAAGSDKLGYDIISGDIPDLFSMSGLPYNTYASKGLLEDLGKRMDSDASFDRSLYLENVLNAPAMNGTVYSVIPYFNVMTATGKTDNVGAEMGWQLEDLQALMQKYPEASVMGDLDRSTVLRLFTMMTMDSFVDRTTGTCKFNSPDFIGLLNFLSTFPETIDYTALYGNMGSDYWTLLDSQYRENRTLLSLQYLSGYSVARDATYNFGGDYTFIGFPCPEGIGSAIMPNLEVGVSSKTKFSDACWEFIKYLLSEDYQSLISYSFPIRKSCLQKMAATAMAEKPTNYEETDIRSQQLTQAQIDQVDRLLSGVKSINRDSDELLTIIEEEAGAFFAGQKTAEAVAATIQSRAQIYVSENG